MSRALTTATANVGDAPAGQLTAVLTRLRDELPGPFALCLQEVTTATEHQVIESVFAGYSIIGARTRCPIIVSPGVEIGEVGINGTSDGIPRLSPPRVAVDVYLPEFNTAVIGGHFPRAFNAPKSLRLRPALIKAWWVHRRGMRDRARYHLKQGHNVTWATDKNSRWRRPKVHQRDVTLAKKGVDWVCAIAARGRTVRRRDQGVIVMGIEKWHACVWATAAFPADPRTADIP